MYIQISEMGKLDKSRYLDIPDSPWFIFSSGNYRWLGWSSSVSPGSQCCRSHSWFLHRPLHWHVLSLTACICQHESNGFSYLKAINWIQIQCNLFSFLWFSCSSWWWQQYQSVSLVSCGCFYVILKIIFEWELIVVSIFLGLDDIFFFFFNF